MCGICGIFCLEQKKNIDLQLLRKMTELIGHRGPDDEGFLLCTLKTGECLSYSGESSSDVVKSLYPELPAMSKASLGLGFRRLAILDTSECGHQPMSDHQLGLHIVFNGEIYNYIELRSLLQNAGYVFSSQSDTEVILKAYHAWGEDCVQRFNGIWSFAIWDQLRRRLFCSRDRFGVKPFYYCIHDGILYFGSELKQLLPTGVDTTLNFTMLRRAMKINSLQVYGKETFWTNITSLEGGNNLIVQNDRVTLTRYHCLDPRTFETSKLSFNDAAESYRVLFQRAVKWQMRSDVEVGACLSGGLDSSAIVCTATKLTDKPMHTFSSYFAELPQLDERRWIAEIASSCGCNSHLTSPGVEQAMDWFAEATWFNDLPLGAGYAAQYGVMKLAQQTGIKVLLDGQGSDELTAGYKLAQYRWQADLLRKGHLSKLIREMAAFTKLNGLRIGSRGVLKALLSAVFSEQQLYNLEFDHLRFEPFNQDFTRQSRQSQTEPNLARIANLSGGRLSNYLFNAVYTTSVPTLLHWEDRMSMAASIESRVPFLDHELVELAFTFPSEFKIDRAQGKLIHRQAIREIVPEAIFNRKDKSIFGAPFHRLWMRQGMKTSVAALFNSLEFRQRGIWNLPLIQTQWQKYQQGDNSQAEMLYNVFALENWFRQFA